MMRTGTLAALLPLLIVQPLQAQDKTADMAPKRTLEVRIDGLSGDTVYLANYYGNKLYYSDTAIADTKGNVVFKAARGYKAGVYAVVVPGPKYFEMVVNEPIVKMATQKDDLLGKLQVSSSKENELFIGYIRFLNEKKLEGDAIKARGQGSEDPLMKSSVKADLERLDAEVKAYQKQLIEDNPGTLTASLVRMSTQPELPELRKPDGTLDSLATYYQYRDHFWDHFDLNDERIVRIPVFANKFEEYMTKVVPQVPDSINRLADKLIARTNSPEVFKYLVHTTTYKFETSDIMGMDAVFVHMAQTYYCPAPGKPSRADWMDGEKLEKLCERARKQAPLTLGKKARNLILPDTTSQRWIGMYDLPQEYVVIVFWDPHCGVCKKELPELYKVYKEELKAMGVEVYAVAKAVDDGLMRDWRTFISENCPDWVNVGLTKDVYEQARKDPHKLVPQYTTVESLNYTDTYVVFSKPKIFLVDGERKFVGKQLSPAQIADLISKLKERKAKG